MKPNNPTRKFDHGDRESREQKALERLGDPNPKCLVCSEPSPLCLELHHIAGRKYHDKTIPLCRNHHVKVTDLQKDQPFGLEGQIGVLEILARFCLGLSDLLSVLADEPQTSTFRDLLRYVAETLNYIGRSLIDMAKGIEPKLV